MICPRCNVEMKSYYCIRCGYMENGKKIGEYKFKSKYEDVRLYNMSFDEMYRNEKKFYPFLLGNFYFSYKNHLFTGFIFGIIDFIFFYSIATLSSVLLSNSLFINLSLLTYVILNRLFYCTFANAICIEIDKYMVKRLNKKDKKESIAKHKDKKITNIFLNVLLYILIIWVFLNLKRII